MVLTQVLEFVGINQQVQVHRHGVGTFTHKHSIEDKNEWNSN
jgi:hypothetical protein